VVVRAVQRGRRKERTYLIRINHKDIPPIIPNNIPRNPQPPPIRLNTRAHLQLKMPIPFTQRLLQQTLHLLLPIPQPSRTRSIRRHRPTLLGLLHSLLLSPLHSLQQLHRLFGRNRISNISKINTANEFLRGEFGDDAPDGFIERFGPKVPNGVYDGPESEVDDAFFGPDPAQLRVGD
jgi:hypothetical protein